LDGASRFTIFSLPCLVLAGSEIAKRRASTLLSVSRLRNDGSIFKLYIHKCNTKFVSYNTKFCHTTKIESLLFHKFCHTTQIERKVSDKFCQMYNTKFSYETNRKSSISKILSCGTNR
jgi:hypothetical protein